MSPRAAFALLAVLSQAAFAEPDAGVPVRPATEVDREVVENLELLEHLDETADLELLIELSGEDED